MIKDRKKESNFAVKRFNNYVYNSKRTDIYGTLINHKNKRNVKVPFKDKVEEKQPLIEVIDIESYKNIIYGKYN